MEEAERRSKSKKNFGEIFCRWAGGCGRTQKACLLSKPLPARPKEAADARGTHYSCTSSIIRRAAAVVVLQVGDATISTQSKGREAKASLERRNSSILMMYSRRSPWLISPWGPYIKDVRKILSISDPSFPVRVW